MMQAILECKNLTKKFGRKTALDDVSLQLKSGKIYGLLGENGSGKTTWMKLIAGLSKPEKGEIFYEGHPLCAKDKESIAYMATENFFYSYMKIKDVEKYIRISLRDLTGQHSGTSLEKPDLTGR